MIKFTRDPNRYPKPTTAQLLRDPRLLLAFGFGSGLSPVIPGTMGTIVGVPALYLLAMMPLALSLTVIAFSCFAGNYLCGYAAKKMGVHDHPGIVWDEFVGLWITFIAVPLVPVNVIVGFVIFRFFDMVKPWPIRAADKHVHGGFGIMLDDIIAGVFSLGCVHLGLYMGWLPWA